MKNYHEIPEWLAVLVAGLVFFGYPLASAWWSWYSRGRDRQRCHKCGLTHMERQMVHINCGYQNKWVCKHCWRGMCKHGVGVIR